MVPDTIGRGRRVSSASRRPRLTAPLRKRQHSRVVAELLVAANRARPTRKLFVLQRWLVCGRRVDRGRAALTRAHQDSAEGGEGVWIRARQPERGSHSSELMAASSARLRRSARRPVSRDAFGVAAARNAAALVR